ncbi:TetR/AcrR family transcriptional regulator [Paenarthrobacter sp. NPDC092416]|uniref:TetR/AcrR family transcriptional regulator n=1 Tax=Paenarthrobacter sp. NPDC092416 TaxID=3364386 RepID=UPI0037FDCCEF
MSTSVKPYHHGDLRAALIAAAVEGLEAGEPFSLRAVARRAGVSPTAPYRHFADREALDTAVAVEGFKDLRADLEAALTDVAETAAPEEVIAALGVAYVGFALKRPAVFRLMFGNECDERDSERVQASEQLHEMLNQSIERLLPGANNSHLSLALWSMAHGLAFLHLDGKLQPQSKAEIATRVQSAVAAVFALNHN